MSLTQTQIPRLVFGTAAMGSALPAPLSSRSAQKRAFAILDAAFEQGIRALDTAAIYQLGGAERLLGRWLASRKCRDQVFLISKGAHPLPVFRPHAMTRKAIESDLKASLKRLRTDRIDLYLLHRDDVAAPIEPALDALAAGIREGGIRSWGVSNWTLERLLKIDEFARARGMPGLAASSPHFSLAEWARVPWPGCVSIAGEAGGPTRAFHERTGLPVLAWSSLGHGFFSDQPPPNALKVYGRESNFKRLERARQLATKRGVSAAQIALAYLFSQSFPVRAVVAARSPEEIRANLAATKIQVSPAEIRWLETGDGSP